MTKEQIIEHFRPHIEISNLVRKVVLDVATLRDITEKDLPENCYVDYEVFLDTETLRANFEEYVYGERNYYSMDIPLSYLWDKNYYELERIRKEEELERAAKDNLQKEEYRKKIQEEGERALLAVLKQKYEK